MKSIFARRVKSAQRSFTREILDLTKKSSVISFAGGLPDTSLFPQESMSEEIKYILANQPKSIFQYSNSAGLDELRTQIAKNYGNTLIKEILITAGSQQGLDLICKAFIDEGDIVIVESPTYLAALNVFSLYGAKIVEVSLDTDGVNIDELESIFKTSKPKFFYTIPTFQNPTGWSYGEDRRKKVAILAKKYSVLIVEDSPYDELIYEGDKLDSFALLLPKQTISLGTFSKVLVPDFRIGWMRAGEEYIKILRNMKENSDLQSSKFFQHVVVNMMKNGKLSLHVELLKEVYKSKRDCMANALKTHLKEYIEFEIPKGGMFFWLKFKNQIDTMKLFDIAIKEGVAFVPGVVFYAHCQYSSSARLNFTNASFEEIEEGVKRVKKSIQKMKLY